MLALNDMAVGECNKNYISANVTKKIVNKPSVNNESKQTHPFLTP